MGLAFPALAAVFIHPACALLTIALFIIHVYMGTAMERGAFGSVIRGDVSRAWAEQHHHTWYQATPSRLRQQKMKDAKWDRRIRRANELASSYPFSAEGLRYYAHLATQQKGLYAEIQKALAGSPKISSGSPLRDQLDLFLLLPKFPGFLSAVKQIAPAPLAQAAANLAECGSAAWQRTIEDFWHGDSGLAEGVDDPEQCQSAIGPA